jgi:FAS-associated factor 2
VSGAAVSLVGLFALIALYKRGKLRRRLGLFMETPTPPPATPAQSGVVLGLVNALSDFIFNLGGAPTAEERDPALAASAFVRNFEGQYGPTHPAFVEGSYTEAVRRARNEFKFLILYLHSGLHTNTPAFCRTTLTSEALVEYVNDNFLIWGGDLAYSEPFRVSFMVGATTFPFLCVLSNADGNVELLERIEGPIGPEELMGRLTNVLENQGPRLIAARSANEQREMDRLIREEQDLAYQESLLADQEKEERVREEERQRGEEERRAREEERRVREEAERKAAHRKNELDKKRARLPSEPREGERSCSIAVRLPDGSRLTRRFRPSDTVRTIYDFVDVNESADLALGSYDLCTNYPRKVLPEDDVTIEAAGLTETQVLLFAQVNS